MKKIILLLVLLIGAAGAIAWQLNRHQAKAAAEIASEKQSAGLAPNVRTAPVAQQEMSLAFTAQGTVQAAQILELIAETDGKVTAVHFATGAKVVAGQLLAELDTDLKRAAHELNELNHRKAKRDVERLEVLVRENNAASIELENARLQLETVENQLKVSQKQLSLARVVAPIAGVVIEKKLGRGSVLQPGSPVATLAEVATLVVRVYLPDREVVRVAPGDRVSLRAGVYPVRTYVGTVRAIIPQASQAKTFPVEIVLENPAQAPLLPGLTVEATFGQNERQTVLTVPRTALTGDPAQPAVYVVSQQTAQKRSLKLGRELSGNIEVISGLQAGEVIVTGGHQNVQNGTKVSPK